MYSQFFGSYLLQRELISQSQLMTAIARTHENRIKIGTIAMTKGLMTPGEVDECLFVQTREDRRFGEIAIERGYLSDAQVHDLLDEQVPDYILLGQTLVEDGCFSNTDLERYLFDYQQENEMYDLDLSVENKDKISDMITKFFVTSDLPSTSRTNMYLTLLFNSLVRFIGDDFTIYAPMQISEYPVTFAISQKISGTQDFITTVDLDRDTAVEFANRYANEAFESFDEYVMASIEDFINLHNGLFLVNISNIENQELELFPPEVVSDEILSSNGTQVLIPILYPFGRVNLIVSF